MATLLMGHGISTGFVNYASPNTMSNIETLGILIGTFNRKKDTLTCKKVLLCDQFGDATNCGLTEAGNIQLAEQLADADREVVCGLIHTHPRHDFFYYEH